MPSLWNDRARFYSACGYLDECYKRLLPRLAAYLDSVHEETHPARYWRIIVGPWLMGFLHVFYDRYMCLREALHRYGELGTMVLDRRCYCTPKDTSDFIQRVYGDGYNLQLYSELLEGMGFAFPSRILHLHGPLPEECGQTSELKRNLAAESGPKSRPPRIAFAGMYFAKGQTAQFLSRLNHEAAPLFLGAEKVPCSSGPVFNSSRNGLGAMPFADEFERLVVGSLRRNVPLLFLENYKEARDYLAMKYPQAPEVLISATGWHYQEAFKLLAADWGEKGTRLVAVQHGFGYGAFRRIPFEHHEIGVADRFVAWGWAESRESHFLNLPAPKLSSLVRRGSESVRTTHNDRIVYAGTAHPRYLFRFDSAPTGSQWADYFEWQCRFLSSLPPEIRSRILLRLPPTDDSLECRPRLRAAFPDVADDPAKTYYESLDKARVVVNDYPGTTFIEALAANIPLVAFWRPDRWEMRENAAADFSRLAECGILWHSPEQAATRVQALLQCPDQWWENDKVQTARLAFIDRYALAREDWAERWKEALETEITIGTGVGPSLEHQGATLLQNAVP